VELYMRDDFGQLLNVVRLKVDDVESKYAVLEVPQINAELISG